MRLSQRAMAWTASGIVVFGLGVVPVVLDRDSFPLSTYPMFAKDRPRENAITTVVAIVDGHPVRLDPRRIAATDEIILAVSTVVKAVDSGQGDALCREVAERVRDTGPTGATSIEIVTEWHDAVAFFQSDREPRARTVHVTCEVPS